MTFEEFQASRGQATQTDDDGKVCDVLLYHPGLVIDIVESGLWCLTIANESGTSMNLEELELKLYEWAKDEGIFDDVI